MVLSTNSINTTTFVASIFGSGGARRGSIPRSGAVTEEKRSQNRKAMQPSGRRFFSAQTSLLAPCRPLKGMRVARASSGPKIPRRKRGCIYETEYLGGARSRSARTPGYPTSRFTHDDAKDGMRREGDDDERGGHGDAEYPRVRCQQHTQFESGRHYYPPNPAASRGFAEHRHKHDSEGQ